MRIVRKLVLTMMLTSIQPVAYGGQVFHCTGADGEMAFSFAPCAAVESTPEVESAPIDEQIANEVEPEVEQPADQVSIDQRIDVLQAELDILRIDYTRALDAHARDGESTNALTAAFDDRSTVIVEELMSLYQQANQIAGR